MKKIKLKYCYPNQYSRFPKISYPNTELATKVVQKMNKKTNYSRIFEIYKCNLCGGYHIRKKFNQLKENQ